MKLILLCSRFPYPLEKGDKLRVFHQIRDLSHQFEITLIALTEEDIDDESRSMVEQYCKVMHVFKISKSQRAFSLMRSIFGVKPLSIANYYNKNVHQQISKIIETVNPDHIYCQLTRMSEYVRDVNQVAKTLDYMDAFGVGMNRRSEVSHFIYAWVYRLEAKRMIAYEAEIYADFDEHTIISEQDRDSFTFKDSDKIHVIPNGVDHDYFTPQYDVQPTHDIGFIGNMGYLPNIQAAEYLVNNIKPSLSEDVKIMITGARPHTRVQQLTQKRVTISGWVDDIRDAYATSKIFVAPLWSGTGQQNKILEAMAMGIPCITTHAVNSAIGAIEGKEIMIADTKVQFVEKINKLLDDDLFRERLAENALIFVKEKYSWSSSNNKLIAILRNRK